MIPDTAWVIEHACTRKQQLSRRVAMLVAERKRSRGQHITAYRCPFAEFTSPWSSHWHVGHPPGMETLEGIARAIRDLHGNAPEPLKIGA